LTHLLEFCKFVTKLECLIMHCHFGYVAREKGAFIENEIIEHMILHLTTVSS
jgi:hypothetical protein